MDEETEGDLALSCFLSGLDEKMKEACKDSLTRHGENVTAFCNLSNYYRDKGDLEKSKYYFEKALTVRKGKEDEPYKLATCAVELGYHEIANECLKKIIDERPYDDVMNFFHGISYLNLGKYSLGLEALTKAYAINREDLVYKYYVDLANDLIENKESARKQLPLRYQKDYPDSVSTRYKRIIKATVKGDMPKKLKEDELLDILKWGIYNSSFSTQRDSVCIAGTMLGKKGSSLLKEALISPNLRDEIKKLSLMTLITSGCKDKISVLARVFFVKVKLRKTLFSGTEDERLYLPAYALAITTAVYSGIEEYEKIGFSANKLYKKYNGLIKEQGYTNEEIATLIICLAGIEKIKSDKDICKNFSVEEKKIRNVLNLIRGEEDDKND
jgi:tetratricopeptide (TPR) repeat protein